MQQNQSDIAIWHAADLQADLIRGHFVNYAYDVHTHDTACFALLTEGKIRIKMPGGEFTAGKGDLYAIDADTPHAGWAVDSQGWKLRTLYVDLSVLNSAVRENSTRFGAGINGPVIHDSGLIRALYHLHVSSELNGSQLLQEQSMLQFADTLLSTHTRKRSAGAQQFHEPAAVRLARDYLDAHLAENVSLKELAAHSRLPVYRLFRAFSRAWNMTPHEYQRQARIRLAIRLIRLNHSLAESSSQSGFTDQAHFTRWFRRFMGVTPGQYQRAIQR